MSAVNVAVNSQVRRSAYPPSMVIGGEDGIPQEQAEWHEKVTEIPQRAAPTEPIPIAQLVPTRAPAPIPYREPKVSFTKHLVRVFASCIATGVIFSAVLKAFTEGGMPIPGIEQSAHT